MAYTFKFSTGNISVGEDPVAACSGITVSYDGNPVDYYGADYRYPLAIELGNMNCEITIESAEFALEAFPKDAGGSAASWLTNSLVDLTLTAGANGGGLTGTIKNCKVVSYEVTSVQDDFVRASLALRKVQYVT